ncbi:MAG: hypothetical protein QXW97_00215 [Candidatus Pacearchaeota archaeon]
MSIPSHLCDNCHSFMKIEKENGDYIMKCPICESKKEENNKSK